MFVGELVGLVVPILDGECVGVFVGVEEDVGAIVRLFKVGLNV